MSSATESVGVCRLPEQRSVDEDLKALAQKREKLLTILGGAMNANSRAWVREYFREALAIRSNLSYLYRHFPEKFELESDLELGLDAFAPVDDADPYQCSAPDLKLIRRAAFQRYAFGLAAQVNKHLRVHHKVSRLWLLKDFLLPRIPLALLIGYGAALGSSTVADWLWALRGSLAFVLLLSAGSLFVSGFLMYLDVREQLGDASSTVRRAATVLGIAVAYCLAFMSSGRLIAFLAPDPHPPFDWTNVVLIADCALAIAVAAQFFFSKSGSIADPL